MRTQSTTWRYVNSALIAVAITSALLLVMYNAIRSDTPRIAENEPLRTIGMNARLDDREIEVKDIDAIERPEPVEPAPLAPRLKFAVESDNGWPGPGIIEDPVVTVQPGEGTADGEMLPIMTVPPEYPQRQAQRGVEGWVVVEFTVDELGRVQAPRVIEAYPGAMFNRAALKAVKRYKYKPRVVNGQSLSVQGVRQRIVFNLSA